MDNLANISEVHSGQRQPRFSGVVKIKLLDPSKMSGEEMNDLWRKISTQDYAFDDFTRGSAQAFVLNLVEAASFHFLVNGAAYVVAKNVYPDSDTSIHFISWDKNFPIGSVVEAGRQVLEWLFREQRVHRITGYIAKFNTSATRFASAMGFKYEGTLRKSLKTHGVFHDVDIYGMLSREFERRFGNG